MRVAAGLMVEAGTIVTASGAGRAGEPRHNAGPLFAALIGSLWLTIHLGCIFFWSWQPARLPLAILIVALQSWLSTGLFIVAHDCMHGSFVPGRPRLNRLVGTIFLGLYAGLAYGALLPKHHAHHAAPGTDADPDFNDHDPRRVMPWFIRFFGGYYTHAQIGRITIAAIAYLLLGASLLNIVIFWAVPALIGLMQLFVFGTYLPHRHQDSPFIDRHRARSSSVRPAISLISCFHFGGYHHEHHLSPATPWWRLPQTRAPRER